MTNEHSARRNGPDPRYGRLQVPDPEDEPEAYKDPAILENLYVDRGWSRSDICDHFGIKDYEVVNQLEEHGIEREVDYSKQPTNGLAKRLYEIGKAEAVK